MKKKSLSVLLIILTAIFAVLGMATFALVSYFANPLTEIYIKQTPTKTSYYETEELDSAGLSVVAKYKYWNIEKEVSSFEIEVASPLSINTKKVFVHYKEKNVTASSSFDISVTPRVIKNIQIISNPIKTKYFEGEFFNIDGLKLQVNCYENAPSFEPKNIQFNKNNIPLTSTDEKVIISYTERENTVFAEVPIIVTEITSQEEEFELSKTLVKFLPSLESFTLNDKTTLDYVKNIINSLTPQQKQQLGAEELILQLTQKFELLNQEYQAQLSIEYEITYSSNKPADDFVSNNPEIYKNLDGAIYLENPTSTQLFEDGYNFLHWTDSKNNIVSSLQNIDSNKSLIAVFELSANIGLNLINIQDSSIIGQFYVPRFNGTEFKYNLLNTEIDNFVFDNTDCFPTKFYYKNVSTSDISTLTKRSLNLTVEIASPQQIIENNNTSPKPNTVSFVFGNNVRVAELENGHLKTNDLSDIYYYYNEQSKNYINYYVIGESYNVFADISILDFSTISTNIIVVVQQENKFDIKVNFSGGEKVFNNLYGKQTVINALYEYAKTDLATIALIDDLFVDFNTSQILTKDVVFNKPTRIGFNIILHDGTTVTNFAVPDDETKKYYLSNSLPALQKLGYIFKGWSQSKNGNLLSAEYLNLVTQNKNQALNLYAIWQINDNYNFPVSQADYTQNFVGEWQTSLNYSSNIINATLSLQNNGFYQYKINSNGETNAIFTGEYRYENNKIIIYSISIDNDFQFVSTKDLVIDLTFVDDNIITSTCFFITYSLNVAKVETLDVVLVKNNVNFANYYGEKYLGTYAFQVSNILTNSNDSYKITLLNNGNAIITLNDLTKDAFYRVVNGKIIIISNSSLGVKDISQYINDLNKL